MFLFFFQLKSFHYVIFCCTDAEEDHIRGITEGQFNSGAGCSEAQRLGEQLHTHSRTRSVSPTERRGFSTAPLSSCPPQARLWVQLMKELRQGVKLKKVQEQPFNTLPTEFSLTPFEMLMQDIRARNFQLRKVMVRHRQILKNQTTVLPGA